MASKTIQYTSMAALTKQKLRITKHMPKIRNSCMDLNLTFTCRPVIRRELVVFTRFTGYTIDIAETVGNWCVSAYCKFKQKS